MDFVKAGTKDELARLKREFDEATQELNKLEKKYIGNTPAQQKTLDILKNIDADYQAKHRTLEAKLEYIKAAFNEASIKAQKEQIRGEKIWDDVISDIDY